MNDVYKFSLIVMNISTLLTFLMTTAFLKSKKESWGKFWVIFFFTTIISGSILIFLLMSPEQVGVWIEKLNGTVVKS